MRSHRAWWHTLMLVGGIFAGAMLWWVALALVAGHFRDRFNDRSLLWMNRIAGLAIGSFGTITLLLARHSPG
jgi:threonine/homoserine/homoserine lactone efflux protein